MDQTPENQNISQNPSLGTGTSAQGSAITLENQNNSEDLVIEPSEELNSGLAGSLETERLELMEQPKGSVNKSSTITYEPTATDMASSLIRHSETDLSLNRQKIAPKAPRSHQTEVVEYKDMNTVSSQQKISMRFQEGSIGTELLTLKTDEHKLFGTKLSKYSKYTDGDQKSTKFVKKEEEGKSNYHFYDKNFDLKSKFSKQVKRAKEYKKPFDPTIEGKRITKGEVEYLFCYGPSERQWLNHRLLSKPQKRLLKKFEKRTQELFMQVFKCEIDKDEQGGFRRGKRLRKKRDYDSFRDQFRKLKERRDYEDKVYKRFTIAGAGLGSEFDDPDRSVYQYPVVVDRKKLTRQAYEPEVEKFSPLKVIKNYTQASRYFKL